MTALDDAARAAEQAAADAAAEQAMFESMEAKVRGGDTTVTADALAEQERLARFAQLRAVGARTGLKQARSDAAVRTAKATIARIAKSDTVKPDALLDAWKSTVLGIRKLLELAAAREAQIAEHLAAVRAQDEQLDAVDAGQASRDLGFLSKGTFGETGFRIPSAGIAVTTVSAPQLLATALEAALGGNLDANAVREALNSLAPSDQIALRPIAQRLPELLAAADQVQHPDVPPALWRQKLAAGGA